MKKGIHPDNYRVVAFKDMSNDHVFLCRSAVQTKETIEVDGETYPVYKMEISNTSHPFYTGKMKLVDTAGRVDKFMSRYQKHYDKKAANKQRRYERTPGGHSRSARLFLMPVPFGPNGTGEPAGNVFRSHASGRSVRKEFPGGFFRDADV